VESNNTTTSIDINEAIVFSICVYRIVQSSLLVGIETGETERCVSSGSHILFIIALSHIYHVPIFSTTCKIIAMIPVATYCVSTVSTRADAHVLFNISTYRKELKSNGVIHDRERSMEASCSGSAELSVSCAAILSSCFRKWCAEYISRYLGAVQVTNLFFCACGACSAVYN
jgi:hypothetical protein